MRRSWWLSIALCFTACKDSDFDGVRDSRDCAPDNVEVSPDEKEVCDGIDNDCDGQVDEDVAIKAFLDRDGDGRGDPDFVRRVCKLPDNGVEVGGDCDDFDAAVFEGADEVCDEVDNNCDGEIDEGVTDTYFPDADGDGYGVPNGAIEACASTPGVSTTDGDCDDVDPDVYPGAPESCDGVDNNCDGMDDEGLGDVPLWVDADGDGFGDPNLPPTFGCGAGPGLADNALDCDDSDAQRSLDATEVRGNGLDEDCDGYLDEFGVGPTSEYATLADALAAAPDGSVVQFDAGVFVETVDLRGRDLTLAGEGCDRTTLYADGAGSAVALDAGGLADLRISGGTGTLLVDPVDPLESPFVGGGVFVAGDASLRDVCVTGNSADRGGGIAVVAGTVSIDGALVASNAADERGGGLWTAFGTVVSVSGSRIVGNTSFEYGGGLAAEASTVDVTTTVLAGNRSRNRGGAVYLDQGTDLVGAFVQSTGTFDHVTFHANSTDPLYTASTRVGEAISTIGSFIDVTNSLFTGHPEPLALVEGQSSNFGPVGNTTAASTGFRGNGGADKDLATYFPNRVGGDPWYVSVDPSLPPEEWDLRLTSRSDFRQASDDDQNPDGTPGDLGAYGGPTAPAGWDFAWTVDDDADGIPTGLELSTGTERYVDDAGDDPDGDGATNREEVDSRTDPFAADTDEDGVDDGVELGLGTDPTAARDHAPVADAGPLVRLGIVGRSTTLDASPSGDPNGDTLGYAWSITSAPPTSVVTVASASSTLDFVADVAGTYVLRVTVDDGTASRWVEVELRARRGFVVPDDLATLDEAMDTVVDGEAIGLRPGVYPANLDLGGRELAFVGLGTTAADVVLEGTGLGHVIQAVGGGVALSGLTVQGGRESQGGGIYVFEAAHLALHDVVVRDNHALDGGGVYADDTPVELTDVSFVRNSATDQGGHFHYLGGDDHEAIVGRRVRFVDGDADEGGALYYDGFGTPGDADAEFDGVEFIGNRARQGAAYRHRGTGSDLRFEHVTFLANVGDSLTYTSEGREFWLSSAIGWNVVDFFVDGTSNGNTQAFGGVWHDLPLDPFTTAGRDLEDVPLAWADLPLGLLGFVDDGDDADLPLPGPGSNLLDAGFIEQTDRDGSRSDASSCGGPTARAACLLALRDLDGDGLPEAWERAYGTDPSAADESADPDDDGLDNLAELVLGTRPDRGDSDLDGVVDDLDTDPTSDHEHRAVAVLTKEVLAPFGSPALLDATASYDPDGSAITGYTWRLLAVPSGSTATIVDPTSAVATLTPDQEGAYRVGLVVEDADGSRSREVVTWVVVPSIRDVPLEYATLQEAYDAAQLGDTIRLGPGSFEAYLQLEDKSITVVGAGSDLTEVVGTPGNPVFYPRGGDLVLRDLSVVGGSNQNGGGIQCTDSALTLERVTVRENVAYTGGGMYLLNCDTIIRDSSIVHNHGGSQAGGLYADAGSLAVERSELSFNTSDGSSGAAVLFSVVGTFSNSVFHGNVAEGTGGGLFVEYQFGKDYGSVVVDHCTFASNDGGQGAVYRLDDLPLTVTNSLFVNNSSYGLYDNDLGNDGLVADHNGFFGNDIDSSPSSFASGPTDVFGEDLRLAAVDVDDVGAPLLEDEDLRLREHSPAIDAGTGPADVDGSVADLGAGGGPTPLPGYDLYLLDSDGDTMADVWESEHGLDPTTPDGLGDSDGDGLSDRSEFPASLPDAADSDGDGVDDPTERAGVGDPRDPFDQAPDPNASSDTTGAVGVRVSRTGSASDPQGDPVTYQWTVLAVPGRSTIDDADLTGATSATVSFVPDTPGEFVLGLAASDGSGTSPADQVSIRVPGTIEVPADYADLHRAVRAAADGTTIDIGPGVWPCAVDLRGSDVTLIGAGPGVTILDGSGLDGGSRGRVIRAAGGEDLTLAGLTLQNGRGGRGGAVYADGGVVLFTDVELLNNVAGEGGAVFLTDGATLDAVGLIGIDNSAGYRGGMLHAGTLSVVTVEQAYIAQNFAPTQGGALRMNSAELTLDNVVLHDNVSDEGGAVYGYGSSGILTWNHVTATYNEGTRYGAVVRLSTSSSLAVVNSVFTGNLGESVVSQTTTGGLYDQRHTLIEGNTADLTFDLGADPDPVDGVDGNLIENGYVVDFVSVTDDGDWSNDDWHLLPTSDAVDAGDPLGALDVDGSLPDLGAYGGPSGAF